MNSYENGKPGRTIIVRLDPGDDLLASVYAVIRAHGIGDGYIASGIGTLSHCMLHMVMTTGYPAVEHFAEWHDAPLELASVSGIIADGTPHLHAVVSNDKRSLAGHVEPGCIILYLGELVIQEVLGQPMKRLKNARNVAELMEKP